LEQPKHLVGVKLQSSGMSKNWYRWLSCLGSHS